METVGRTGNNLIVRVKRKRESLPNEQLLIEGVPGFVRPLNLSRQLANLSTESRQDNYPQNKKRLSLFRLSGTTGNNINILNDTEVIHSVKRIKNDQDSRQDSRQITTSLKSIDKISNDSTFWTTNKKTISDGVDSYVIVDIFQDAVKESSHHASITMPKTTIDMEQNKSFNKVAHRVLDPITRSFDIFLKQAYIDGNNLIQCVEYIHKGANVNYRSHSLNGITALMIAAYYSNVDVVSSLLQLGADATIKDYNNKSALDYAQEFLHNKIDPKNNNMNINNNNNNNNNNNILIDENKVNQINLLLLSSLQNSKFKKHSINSNFNNNIEAAVDEEDFVYDIYSTIPSVSTSISSSMSMSLQGKEEDTLPPDQTNRSTF